MFGTLPTEDESQRAVDDTVAEALPHLAGHQRAAWVFQRKGAWNNEGGLGRFARKLLGREGEGPPDVAAHNLLVLMSDRMYLVACQPKHGRWVPGHPIGDWALTDLTVRADERSVSRFYSDGERRYGTLTIEVVIDVASQGRSLELEATLYGPSNRLRAAIEALLDATGGGRIACEWADEEWDELVARGEV